jgi:hypothetical protein
MRSRRANAAPFARLIYVGRTPLKGLAMDDSDKHPKRTGSLEAARLARARRSLRWRTRARYPAQRLLERLTGSCVPMPLFEACRQRVELLRGVLARAGVHPDDPQMERTLVDRRRPDLAHVPGTIERCLGALERHARPLAPASWDEAGQYCRSPPHHVTSGRRTDAI